MRHIPFGLMAALALGELSCNPPSPPGAPSSAGSSSTSESPSTGATVESPGAPSLDPSDATVTGSTPDLPPTEATSSGGIACQLGPCRYQEDCVAPSFCRATPPEEGAPSLGVCVPADEACSVDRLTVQADCSGTPRCVSELGDAFAELETMTHAVRIIDIEPGGDAVNGYPVNDPVSVPEGTMVVLRTLAGSVARARWTSYTALAEPMLSLQTQAHLILDQVDINAGRDVTPAESFAIVGSEQQGAFLVAERSSLTGYAFYGIQNVESALVVNTIIASAEIDSTPVRLGSGQQVLSIQSTLVGGIRRGCADAFGCVVDRDVGATMGLVNNILVPTMNITPAMSPTDSLASDEGASYAYHNLLFWEANHVTNNGTETEGNRGTISDRMLYFETVPVGVMGFEDFRIGTGERAHCIPASERVTDAGYGYPVLDIDGRIRAPCQGAGADITACDVDCG